MRHGILAVVVGLLSACATVVPLQTASVVEPGRTRVGGQLSAAAFCGNPLQGPLGIFQCTEPADSAPLPPLPELRVNVRRGLGGSSDLGASLQVLGQPFSSTRPLQLGLTLDGKRELLSHTTASGSRHVLSAGLLLGSALSGRLSLAPSVQLEWGVPLYYGLQVQGLEWVVGAHFSQRWLFNELGTAAPLPLVASSRLGLSVGLMRREPAGWAVQLGYLADAGLLRNGALQLGFGWLYDL